MAKKEKRACIHAERSGMLWYCYGPRASNDYDTMCGGHDYKCRDYKEKPMHTKAKEAGL